jgi:HlyD family secretion protein
MRKAFAAPLLALVFIAVTILWLTLRAPANNVHARSGSSPASPPTNRAPEAVGCLGYIEPKDGVLEVSGAYLEGRPQRVLELKVQQGDEVHAGQLLAVLDGRDQLQTAVQMADARVALAQARLSQVKAGASASDIAAQQAIVNQMQAALANARSEYHRFEALHEQTDVSQAELEARKLAVETDEQGLKGAEERLESISRVRPTDIDVARSELAVAMAEAEEARANLKTSRVEAPTDGRILQIHAYPGEEAGPEGILDLGRAGSMYVRAEVYEADIARVHPGERATITSDLFSGSLSGTVEVVGAMIAKADVMPLDPVTFADARVFKVWIRLDDGERIANLIHGKVNVVIRA